MKGDLYVDKPEHCYNEHGDYQYSEIRMVIRSVYNYYYDFENSAPWND